MELQLVKNFSNRLVSTIDLLAKLMKRQLMRIKSTVFLKSLVIYKRQKAHIQHQAMPTTPFQSPRASMTSSYFSGSLGVTIPGPYLRDVLQLPSNSNF